MKRSVLTLIIVSAWACTTTAGEDSPVASTQAASTLTVPPPASTSSTLPGSTVATTTTVPVAPAAADLELVSYPVPAGSGPHDVAPAADGGVWYTAQASGELGWLDPASGETRHIDLGDGSAPHGVIVDARGAPWITDSGLNAILSVDPNTEQVTSYPMPGDAPDPGLHTAAFDGDGTLWFTGQNGFYGSVTPGTAEVQLFSAPEGRGPYGITVTPDGAVYYASLAGSHIARIELAGEAVVIEPPTPEQGARRVWSDSMGGIWVSEWNSGNLSRYSPGDDAWDTFPLPGEAAQAYAVYVDEHDMVWASDFGSNSMVRLDPVTGLFDVFSLPHEPGNVRQILGRAGEVWAAESAADSLFVIRERRP